MPDTFQESLIRRVPMFSQLPDYQFQLLARVFELRRYNPNDYVLFQGTEVPGLLIIAEGQLLSVKVAADGAVIEQAPIFQGQALYQAALFEALPAQTHLQAVQPTTMLVLARAAMGNLVAHHPELKAAFGLDKNQEHHLHEVHFKTQRENERVLLKTRRHWFSMMRWMWAPLVLIVFGLILAAGIPQIAILTVPAVFIIGIGSIIYIVLEWANDSVIVTDQRVVRIIHTILTFHEVRDEVALESIQEANAHIPSFDLFALFFHYGDVEIKTAGAKGNYKLDFMPNPEQLQDLIIEDARKFHASKHLRERETMMAEVERWIDAPFRSGQNPSPTQKNVNAVSEQKIKNVFNPGAGPASPFVTSFPTESGGIVYRKHWFVWLRAITIPSIWIVASLIGMIIFLFSPVFAAGLVGWLTAFLAFLIGVVWFYFADWDWRHDYYLISDSNITIVNQRPLWLQNESDQILLKQVDNVVAETKGIFQQMFKYGDVKVALVGADSHKLFDNVANPRDVQSEITRRQQRLKQSVSESEDRAQREAIGEYLSLYHQAQQQKQNAPQIYPQDRPLPYAPSTSPQVPQAAPNERPTPSPFGRRPTMSEGRPYIPTSQPPPSRPPQSPYRPGQVAPYQQKPQTNQVPPYQPGQYPQQGNNEPNQAPIPPPPPINRPPKFPKKRDS